MSRNDIEQALVRGVEILEAFVPSAPFLIFPILSSVCVWAVRRVFNYRDHILTWQVWLDPETVRTKPDDFVLHFFRNERALAEVFAEEIASGDIKRLRTAFAALYPILGLEDAFLRALFRPELEAGDVRKIVAEFRSRAAAAVEKIRPAASDPAFWRFLETIGMELASLGLHLLQDDEIQALILEAIREKVPPEEEELCE